MTEPRESGRARDGKQVKVSLWAMERLLRGELAREEEKALHRSLSERGLPPGTVEEMGALAPARGLEALRKKAESRSASAWQRLGTKVVDLVGERGAAPKFAFGAAVVALACIGTFTLDGAQPVASHPAVRSKGGPEVEFRARISPGPWREGGTLLGRSGDTLSLQYRAKSEVFQTLWYQEDGLPPVRIEQPAREVLRLSESPRWAAAGTDLVLEGRWREQRIWVLASREPVDPAMEPLLLEDESLRMRAGVRMLTFHIRHR